MTAKILCVDFDGTVVEHKFPEIGDPLPGAFGTLKDLKAAGWVLVLWTCREDRPRGRPYLSEAVAFCGDRGVLWDGINETPPEHDFRADLEPRYRRKAFGHVYVDDRNLGGFPGWDAVRRELLETTDQPPPPGETSCTSASPTGPGK